MNLELDLNPSPAYLSGVSIPIRDLMNLELQAESVSPPYRMFQSLLGI